MADPICRWRNSSVKQVMEFNSIIPFGIMNKSDARELVENRWKVLGGSNFFTTPYQLAVQMCMYYEDNDYLYPKFIKPITIEQAQEYMCIWAKNYYVPNPYTPSLDKTKKPVIINNFLVNWCLEHDNAKFSEALNNIFEESIGNTDILVNMLNNFSEVSIDGDILTLKQGVPITPYSKVYLNVDKNDRKFFFEFITADLHVDYINKISAFNYANNNLQQIFYGAPGTGKSHIINEQTENEEVIRTTFHPDSDYSTFVGAYKPTTKEITLRDDRGLPVYEKGVIVTEDRIIYEFVKQAFLQAYINAWKFYAEAKEGEEIKKQYLVIEEINRGNCAQIFGDLFQLLDRNQWGFSEYPIKADNDMRRHLEKEFDGLAIAMEEKINSCYKGKNIVRQVLMGESLLLPNNLYIWATMNTSDQSLFPIDSAFKRRWDWKYMPIDSSKENWCIRVNNTDYSWTDFLDKINDIVREKTQSEDKQLGFYFCKAKDGVIDAETFVGKVLFYLWNDVFKDYGFDDEYFVDEKLSDGSFKPLAFRNFYDVKTRKVIETQAEKFLKNLKIKVMSESAETTDNTTNG